MQSKITSKFNHFLQNTPSVLPKIVIGLVLLGRIKEGDLIVCVLAHQTAFQLGPPIPTSTFHDTTEPGTPQQTRFLHPCFQFLRGHVLELVQLGRPVSAVVASTS